MHTKYIRATSTGSFAREMTVLVVASHSTSEGDGSEWSRGNDLATGGGGKFVCVCVGGGD